MTDLPTRAEVRGALAAVLSNELIGDGKPVQAVYAYRKRDLGGASPVIALGSGGSDRTASGRLARVGYTLDVFIFVLYALMEEQAGGVPVLKLDEQGAPVWDEQDAENALDAVEHDLAVVVSHLGANRPLWQSLAYESPSQTQVVDVGGLPHYLEVASLHVEVF